MHGTHGCCFDGAQAAAAGGVGSGWLLGWMFGMFRELCDGDDERYVGYGYNVACVVRLDVFILGC